MVFLIGKWTWEFDNPRPSMKTVIESKVEVIFQFIRPVN